MGYVAEGMADDSDDILDAVDDDWKQLCDILCIMYCMTSKNLVRASNSVQS